jgi:hypothetical protein
MPDMNEKELQKVIASNLRECGSNDLTKAAEAQRVLAAALESPLKDGIEDGDTVSGLYTKQMLTNGARAEYPISFYRNDNANEYVAYVIPAVGRIPQRIVEGDYITVPTYDIGNAIDIPLKYVRDANWPVVERAISVLEAGFTKKRNDDGWHAIISAGNERNIMAYDSAAAGGSFTKRLVSLMKVVMRRNAGGNSTSINRGKLTHLFVSPEGIEDIRNWDETQLDETTRREIYTAEDGSFNKIFGVTLVDLDELGEQQEYQDYFTEIGGTLASNDLELVIGIDKSRNDSFYHPVREEFTLLSDPTQIRANLWSMYGREEAGWGVLNGARVLLGSF